tara:strand:- start:2813 stop:3733 length:921 start_codon:yes stop_codon:yes gene_type:complete
MEIIDKIKSIIINIPYIYYVVFLVVIITINLFINYNRILVDNIYKEKKKLDEEEVILFNEETVRSKYNILDKVLGEPPIKELYNNIYAESVTWRMNYTDKNFIYGKYNGFDLIKLTGYIAKKNHPIPGPVFIIAGKYIKVPEHLYGPLKYASPTINIEQLYIPQEHSLAYEKTGKKNISLVTGSCASITICAITIKFVEDMISKFKDNMDTTLDIHIKFRKEYNVRILSYLCGKGITPEISWYDALNFKEENIYDSKSDVCGLLNKNESISLIYEDDNLDKVIESVKNNISKDKVTKKELKDLIDN